MDSPSTRGIGNAAWKAIYLIGGIAALMAAILFRRNLSAELTVLQEMGLLGIPVVAPVRAVEWFNLLQSHWLAGLTMLAFFDVIEYVLVGLFFLGLYGSLEPVDRSLMLLASVCGFTGIVTALATNRAIAMLSVSGKHAAATTIAEREMLLTAGETLLRIHEGAGGYIGLFLVLLAGFLISIVMRKSNIFSRATAWMGLLANGIGLCFFLAFPFGPMVYWFPPAFSAPFRLLWYFLAARKLFQLAVEERKIMAKKYS